MYSQQLEVGTCSTVTVGERDRRHLVRVVRYSDLSGGNCVIRHYHLFHSMDNHILGNYFAYDAVLCQALKDIFASKTPECYRHGIWHLEASWLNVLILIQWGNCFDNPNPRLPCMGAILWNQIVVKIRTQREKCHQHACVSGQSSISHRVHDTSTYAFGSCFFL